MVFKNGVKGLHELRFSAATTFQIKPSGRKGWEFFYLDFLRFNLFGNQFDDGGDVTISFLISEEEKKKEDSAGLQDNEHTYYRVFNYINVPMEVKKKHNVSLFILYNRCFKTYVFKRK